MPLAVTMPVPPLETVAILPRPPADSVCGGTATAVHRPLPPTPPQVPGCREALQVKIRSPTATPSRRRPRAATPFRNLIAEGTTAVGYGHENADSQRDGWTNEQG